MTTSCELIFLPSIVSSGIRTFASTTIMPPPKTAVKQDAGDSLENFSPGPSGTLVSVFTLIFLAAAATALRFHFLTRKPFWFDECFSAVIARLSWHDFVRLLWWREANMALYYVLLRGWLNLDSEFSPFFIRSFSVLASLATLPAIFWLGSKLFDRRDRSGCAEPQYPAPLGDGDHRRGHGPLWHPRHR